MFGNADELFKFIKDEGVEYLDVRFTDLPGIQQQVTLPASTFDADMVANGVAFDGSSIRGFQTIDQSDMVLFPDIKTAYVDPFKARKTIAMDFFVHDPITGEAYSRDPRNIARKAEAYLATTGIGDTAYFAPEAEFYIFDRVNYGTSANKSFYEITSAEAAWSTGDDIGDNRGYKVRYKGGYFPVAPTDKTADLRNDMMTNLTNAGLTLERGHHEVGTSGQAEINYRFDTLLKAADDVMKFKYIVRNTAWANDKTVTFMPKPIFGDNGSGMHVHQSIWNEGSPLFYDEAGYGGLSDLARHYIGGILSTRRRCSRSPTRRSTPTTVWCRASRRRSRWSTRPATARLVSVSRSRDRTPRPSASSSVAPTRRPTRTSPSRRCCWPDSTASRTRSSRRPRSTRTSTSCRPRSTKPSTWFRPPSTRCSTRSRPTTSSSPLVTCSRPT